MALRALGSLLNLTLQRHGVVGGVEAAQVIESMEKVLWERWGNMAKTKMKVKFYKQNAIYLSCSFSLLAQEVRLHEQNLLEELRKELGGRVTVEKIKFVA